MIDQSTKVGRQYFQWAYENFKTYYTTVKNERPLEIDNNSNITSKAMHCIGQKAYQQFFRDNQVFLGHYFRNAYHILRSIDESSLTDKEKIHYAKLFSAQLSSDEQHLLFYNCFCGPYGKFANLAKLYDVFDTMDDITLLEKNHRELFMKK